jgi:hypothetical protein
MGNLKCILKEFYVETFEKIKTNKNEVLLSVNIKDINAYKTNTAAKILMTNGLTQNPNFSFSKSMSYFYIHKNVPNISEIEIYYKLDETPIYDLNLYKFFGKIQTILYHILSTAIKKPTKNDKCFILKHLKNTMQLTFRHL